jgi:hypothetical protein
MKSPARVGNARPGATLKIAIPDSGQLGASLARASRMRPARVI